MANWKKIRKEFETTRITLKELAIEHGIKGTTLRSRKTREKWQRLTSKQSSDAATDKHNVATQHKKLQHNSNDVATQDAADDKDLGGLNPQQYAFCQLRAFRNMSAYKAYLKVYDETGEMSDKTAMTQGYKLLKQPKIREKIAELVRQNGQKIAWDFNKALDEAYKNYKDATDNVLLYGPHQANVAMMNNYYDKLNELLRVNESSLDKAKINKIKSEIRVNESKVKEQNNGMDVSIMNKLDALSVDQLISLANQSERRPDEEFNYSDYED